jgi:hypothetical protein
MTYEENVSADASAVAEPPEPALEKVVGQATVRGDEPTVAMSVADLLDDDE